MAEEKYTLEQFGQKIKAKYPQYNSLSDVEVATKTIEKYPQYKSSILDKQPLQASEDGSVQVDTKPTISITKDKYEDLQKQYTALDSTFKNLNADLKTIQNPLQNTDIKDFMPVNVFGANIIVPRIKESQPTTGEPKVSENHPYKGLLRLSAKEQNIPENVYEDDSPSAIYLQNKINEKFLQDAQQIEALQTPDEISSFLADKKKTLSDLIAKQKINTINTSSISDIERGNTGYGVDTKLSEDDLEEKAISDDLDAVAQSNAFKKAPVMSKDVKSWINIPNSHIISVAEQVGNDIQNISNESERALFKARGDINEGSVQYDKLHKDNLAYIGLQAEIYSTETELAKDNETVSNKFQEIDDLTQQLQKDPTNKSLIEEIKTKSLEITPLKNSIEEKKQFVQKLYSATLELSEIGKSIARQEKADAYDAKLKDEFGASITRPISRGIQEIGNAVSSTLKGSAIIGNELAFQLGTKSKEDTDIIKSNLLGDESGKFIMPSRIANKQVLEFKKDSNIPSNINWDMALQKTVSTTGEMLLMGAIGAPLAESGTILGKLGGLYLGSTLVFGGDILESELGKGLSVGEATFVTGLRLGVEAATEMVNPLEFIPFNGVVPKAIGQATKGDFIRYVGNNWKTLLPKVKAAGYDVKDFLWHTGKSVGFESFEEVLSDLGNYGVDKYVINNIKPNYRQDNDLTLQGEINTALTTALTMIPAGIYQGIVETKQEKTAPYLRMAAAQTPKLFLNNLEDNLKKGRITKEFYEKGVNDVKNISSLYEFNKAKIELAPEDEQSAYFNAIYNYDVLSKAILSETDPKKSQELSELLTKASKEVEKFDKEFVPLVNNPQAQNNKKEEIHLQNIEDFTSPDKLKQNSVEDLMASVEYLQQAVDEPFSQKVKDKALEGIRKVNDEMTSRNKVQEVSTLTNQENLSNYDYLSQNLQEANLTQEKLDLLTEEEIIQKASELKSKSKQSEEYFNLKLKEAQVLPTIEEQGDALAELLKELRQENSPFKVQAAEELDKIDKQLEEKQQKASEITFSDGANSVSFPENTIVTYQGGSYKVQKDKDGNPILLNDITKAQVKPSNVTDIKKREIEVVKEDKGEDVFGKREEPAEQDNSQFANQELEAKKADIERRRKEELTKLDEVYRKETSEAMKLTSIDGGKALGDLITKNIIDKKLINAKYDAELAALGATTTTSIKPGVEELFDENPELANAVYEALGFSKKLDFYKGDTLTIDEKIYSIVEKISSKELAKRNGLTISSNIPVYIVSEFLGSRKGGYDTVNNIIILSKDSDKETIHHELIHSVEYNLDKSELNHLYEKVKDSITEDSFNGFVSWNFKKNISEFVADALSKKVFRNALKKEGLLEEVDNVLSVYTSDTTPQQKQQAKQLYQQYLESLNKLNTNPILQNNQQEQVKKFAELQERLNNKEFLEGAKNAYENSEGLKSFGTQEQYNDYIARVSLGIIKNPSSGDYNYTSKVKDIVYHGTDNDNFQSFYNRGDSGIHFGTLKAAQERRTQTDFEFKNKYKFISSILNLKNPLKTNEDFNFERENLEFENNPDWDYTTDTSYRLLETYLHKLGLKTSDENGGIPNDEVLKKAGYDGLIYKNEKEDVGNNSYAVFEPEQIHILGSKQDIEGFKKFVDKINAKYDAEYIDKVKKGEFTKQQAKDALKEINRLTSELEKQIDDTELAALEQSKVETKEVISTEDLLKLAASKDKSVTNKEFQSKAKQITGEKHIAKMNEEQRAKMEKYLNTLKSRREKAEDRKKAIEEEKKQGLAEIEKSGLTTKLAKSIKAVWSNTTNRFVFFKSNGKQITSTNKIVELAEELANKIGFVKTWWNSLITEEQKQKVINYLNDLEYEERKNNGLIDESIVTPRLALLQLLKNAKFSPDILKDLTDVNAKAWTNDKAKSLDDYVRNYVSNTDVSEGVLAGMDEQEITNEILELIAEFPNGITEKDIQEEKQSDTDIGSKIIINDFAEEFGLDLEIVKDKLVQEIEDFKKEAANSTQLTTKEILNLEDTQEDTAPPVTDDAEVVEETPVVVDTPEAKEVVKQEEKEQKKTESHIFRSGKVQNSTWNKSISKILKNTENYTISVINANKVAFSQLPESFPGSAQKFWDEQLTKKENKGKTIQEIRNEYNKKNNDKFLAISDKQGNLLYFDEEGNITTEEKGSLALSNFPTLGNEATQEARDSKTKTTFIVKQITNEPISVSVKTESKSAKQLVEENKLTPTLETEGRNVFLVNNGQRTQIFSRNLSEDEIQTIVNLTKKWNTNKQEIKEFIEGILYQGFKTPINFVFDYKATRVVAYHVVDGVNGSEFTEEELRDFLANQPINFSRFVNGKNKPFITFTVKEGVTNGVQKATEHPSYQDFILSNFSINSNQKELKDKFFVEVGDKLGSEAAQIDEAETQPKVELEIPVKKEVKETPIETTPTEETPKKSLISKFANKKKNDSDRTLNRGKHLVTKTTEEQEKEAEEWVKNSPLFEQKEELRILRDVINSDAWATYRDAVITLWKGGKFTDVYHEAWHKFSQLHLTKKQKLALYNEVRKLNIPITLKDGSKIKSGEASDFQIEEHIAEDFKKYAIAFKAGNPLILNNRPQRNSIFRKIMNYFRALFKRDDLQTYYEKLYTGNIKSYQRNLDNSFFAELNRGIEGVVDGKAVTLTDEQTKDLYKGINSLIGQIFQDVKKPSSLMLDNTNNVSTKIYGFVKEDLENIAIDLSKSLSDRESEYPKMSKEDKAKYDADYQALENVAFAIDNWAEVVKNHPKFSKEFKNVNVEDYLNEEETPVTQSSEGEIDTTDDEAIERGSEIAKNSNTSSKEAASKETISLISSLHKWDNGKKVFNKFFPMIQEVVDFGTIWDEITQNVNNTLNYDQIIEKLKKLGETNETYNELVSRLPDPSINGTLLSPEQFRLRNAFVNDISKPKVDMYELVITPIKGGGISVTYTTAAATDERKLKQDWTDAFNQITPDVSEHKKEDKNGNLYLDLKSLLEDTNYNSVFPDRIADFKTLDKNEVFNKRLEFLTNLGIVFSEPTLNSPEFFDFITKKNSLDKLRDFLKDYKNKEVKNRSEFFKKENTPKGKDYWSKIEAPLIAQELTNSKKFFSQSVKNAEGSSEWLIKQWNYISKVYNSLNDVETYPTYQSLQKAEWLKQFDIDGNPYANGLILRTLFNLDKTSSTYGQRRVVTDENNKPILDKNGNFIYPKITLQNYNGVKVVGGEGTNEGKTTTRLSGFEKLVQNMNTLLLKGVQEHLRYGDKSSSFGTAFSHILDPISGKLVEIGTSKRGSIIPVSDFVKDGEYEQIPNALPTSAYRLLLTNLASEIMPMQRNVLHGVGNNFTHYKNNIKELGVFNSIVSKENKERIQKEIVNYPTDLSLKDIYKILSTMPLQKDFEEKVKRDYKNLQKQLDTKGSLSPEDYLHKDLLYENGEKRDFKQIGYAYVVNSLLYNIEHTKLITQDPRFYKVAVVNKETGEKNFLDFYKRIQAFLGDGNIFVVDKQTNKYLGKSGVVDVIQQAVAKKLSVTIPPKSTDGTIKSVIFKDNEYTASKLVSVYMEYFVKQGFPEEYLKQALKAYNKINEADGQGYMTLDEFKQSKLRAGSSHWTEAHEIAYQKEAAFLRGEEYIPLTKEEVALFMPQKWQYGGITTQQTGLFGAVSAPVYYKFSAMPLIPSMIKDTPLEQIHDNLVKQGVGLATFESGSKISSIQNENGQFNPFYQDYNTRTPYTGEYTFNNIHYQYLKEQVNIDPSLKEKVTFSTQMRKLLFINTFTNGVANKPEFAALEKRFTNTIKNLISEEKNTVIKNLGAVLDSKTGNYILDDAKVAEFFKKEFEERGLPDEVVNYLQVGQNGKFTYALDASLKRAQIEKIIASIANNRLVKQKINGEALIQLAATGLEHNSTARFNEVQEDTDLRPYTPTDKGTLAMQIKIAFSKQWRPLLNLTYKGEKIKTVERLNEAIKDENWLNTNNHRAMITVTGVRIPVQGLNSHEFMEVQTFLPESAGGVIVMHPSIVAKSGGDFDIDKLTTFFPNLFENKYTGEVKLYNTKDLKIKDGTLAKQIKNIVKPSVEKLQALNKIRQDLKQEMAVYREQKEGIKQTKEEIKLSLRKLDLEIAVSREQLDLLEEAEFALTNPDDITVISDLVANTIGEEGLIQGVQSAIEQTKSVIRSRINEGVLNQQFLLKAINTSLKELNEDLNYTRLNVKNIEKSINPIREYLAHMQELVYQSSTKKAYQNDLIDIMKQVLSHPDNAFQLIRPNDIDLLKPDSEVYKELNKDEDYENSFASAVDFNEAAKQFVSNLVSKSNLGIAAVMNVFSALSQRAGLTLNPEYTHFTTSGKPVSKKTRINLAHNTVKVNGEERISLSGYTSKEQTYPISDIISQMINGYLEVAKDSWVFNINAVREFLPTMMFTTMAGVDAKTMIAFFNQPIMNEYLKDVQKYKSLFMKAKDPEAFQFATIRAVEDIILSTEGIKDTKLLSLIEALVKEKTEERYNEEGILQKPFTYFLKENILNYLQDKAEENKDLFTEKRLTENANGVNKFTPEENLMVLAHFVELELMSKKLSNLQRSLNADTKKMNSLMEIQQRQKSKELAEKSGLFPQEAIDKLFNQSTISAFTHTKYGFDSFSKSLWANLLEISNHPEYNRILSNLIDNDKSLKFEFKNSNLETFSKTLKNDFITYLYHNNVFDNGILVASIVKQLLKPGASSFVSEFRELKSKYPNLTNEFPFLGKLTTDVAKGKANIKFNKRLDAQEANSAVQQVRSLLKFNNPEYTKEQQIEIQSFADKYVKFAIIQSGLNSSIYDLTESLPNESYSKDMNSFVKAFKEILDNPLAKDEKGKDYNQAEEEVKKFYKLFKTQRIKFFNKAINEETGETLGNTSPERGVNYVSPEGRKTSALDITGKKAIIESQKKQNFFNSIPTLTSFYNGKEGGLGYAQALKGNGLVVIEDFNDKRRTSKISNSSPLSLKELSDDNFNENKELIDKQIEEIKEKAYKDNTTSIVFNSAGYGQEIKEKSPKTFLYLSSELYLNFRYENKGFLGVYVKENIDEIMKYVKKEC